MNPLFWRMLLVLAAAALVVAASSSAATPSRIEIAVCSNITTILYPGLTQQPPGCAITTTCMPLMDNSDLGTFVSTQNPLGVMMHASAPNDCTTSPPKLGAGADGATVRLNVVQTGFCPTSSAISAQLGPQAFVVVPIGSLPLGTYTVTAMLPQQTVGSVSWLESHASGTLHVGAAFTETDSQALVSGRSTFAAVVRNSVAGQGAGRFTLSKAGNSGKLEGTDYFACGTINLAAALTFGKRGRLAGSGTITGGTGNYVGLGGTFRLSGTYNSRTGRGTLRLSGNAKY